MSASPDVSNVIESRLKGRGPVYVSPDNPFIAANKFLDTEAASSIELAGLLKLRGNPQRIELKREIFGDPQLTLYYDQRKEVLSASKVDGVWVFEQSASLSSAASQASVASKSGTPSSIGAAEKLPEITGNAVTVQESPGKQPFRSEQPPPSVGPALSSVVARCRTISDLSQAERSPAGDLIHYVVDDRETPTLIAEWYVGESAPAGTIMRLNKLSPKTALTVGDQIVIPKYLVRNGLQLGTKALRCVLTEKAIATPIK